MVKERFTQVDGLRVRYLEDGAGPAVLMLHGASLGSSAEVWAGNLVAFAAHGFRAIAFDQPGFGLSDDPLDHSAVDAQTFVLAFMDALGLERTHLIGHSMAGRTAVNLGFAVPQRVGKVIVLGTGSLLPPLPNPKPSEGPREGQAGGATEPTLADTRKLLEQDLFNHALITEDVLAARHRMSVGKNFRAFLARNEAQKPKQAKEARPIWQRLPELPVPLMLIYGKQDRASAGERAALLKQQSPELNLHVVDRCKHLVPWDAAEEFTALSTRFLGA
jgi:4,5:9,10-diseco-3-hydroxy-5,9,17-trioxoandrosta-1(10),2-diene-4-oate hydrolase